MNSEQHEAEAVRLLTLAKQTTERTAGVTMHHHVLEGEQRAVANLVAMAHVHAILARR